MVHSKPLGRRYGPDDALWVVTDAGPVSELGDICFRASLRDLLLLFDGGLTLEQHPTLFTDEDDAVEDAKNRLLARNAARLIRKQRRLPADEVVRITLHDESGAVLWNGDVR